MGQCASRPNVNEDILGVVLAPPPPFTEKDEEEADQLVEMMTEDVKLEARARERERQEWEKTLERFNALKKP